MDEMLEMHPEVIVLAAQIPVDLLNGDLNENRVLVVEALEQNRTDLKSNKT